MQEYALTTYSFNELSEEAQEKAIEKHTEFLNEIMDCDELAEVMNWKLATLTGQTDEEDRLFQVDDWDLGYSQGSHVGIKGEATRAQCPSLAWPEGADSVSLSYHHYYGQQGTLYDAEGEEMDDVDKNFSDSIYSLAQDLMSAGYKEIEYQTSEEVVKESILANEYDFHDDGSLVSHKGLRVPTNSI